MLARNTGFTLIELVITVAILGILSMVLVPKFTVLINRAKDANTKGNLGVLRSALSLYNADTEGRFPSFPSPYSMESGYGTILEETLIPKYLNVIPTASPSGGKHNASNEVIQVWNHSGSEDNEPVAGWGWKYDANPFNDLKPEGFKGLWGTVMLACTHNDSNGRSWTGY